MFNLVSKDGQVKFLPVLQLLFIIFKLTGQIDWSWLWVLLPIELSLVVLAFCGLLWGLGMLLMGKEGRAKYRAKRRLQKALAEYSEALRTQGRRY